MARGFLISEGLHRDIKQTIARVQGMPDGQGASKIPTRFESIAFPASPQSPGLRLAQYAGTWPREYIEGNLKFVTLYKLAASPTADIDETNGISTGSNIFVPDEDAGSVVVINLFAYLPSYGADSARWCLVQELGQIEVTDPETDASSTFPFYILVAAEC